MLIDAQTKDKARSLANLAEVAAENFRIFEARLAWNASHPDAKPIDTTTPWNHGIHAARIFVRIFGGERLTLPDVEFLDSLLVRDTEPTK